MLLLFVCYIRFMCFLCNCYVVDFLSMFFLVFCLLCGHHVVSMWLLCSCYMVGEGEGEGDGEGRRRWLLGGC